MKNGFIRSLLQKLLGSLYRLINFIESRQFTLHLLYKILTPIIIFLVLIWLHSCFGSGKPI